VYATPQSRGYRYARRYVASLGHGRAPGDDDYIDYQAGDVFLGLDLQFHVTRAQEDYLALLRQHGVGVFFVVYDILPMQFPQFWPFGETLRKEYIDWLRVIAR